MGVNQLPSGSVKDSSNVWHIPKLSKYGKFYYKNGRLALNLKDLDIFFDETGQWSIYNLNSIRSEVFSFSSPSSSQTISVDIESKSIDITSSFASTASYYQETDPIFNLNSSSFVRNSQTSSMTVLSASYALTASYLLGSVTSASYALSASNVLSSSYALTASYLLGSVTSASNALTASYSFTSSYSNYLDFNNNLGSIPSLLKGRVYFDKTSDSLNYYNTVKEIHLGQETLIPVKNVTGATLTKGQAVYINGSSTNNAKVSLSISRNHAFSTDINGVNEVVGVVVNDITNNSNGYIMIHGILDEIDTSSWVEGDTLWLSNSISGSYSNTVPSPPYDRVKIGIVVTSDASGKIFIFPENSIHFNNISGVSGSLPPNNGDIWVYNSSSGVFYNTKSGLSLSGSFSGSFNGLASSASYYQETDPIFNLNSSSFVRNSQTSSMTVLSASNALSASFALTSSVVVDKSSLILLGRSASIAATTLFTTPSENASWYQVNWLAAVKTPAGTSCILGPIQIRFTHGVDNVVKTWPAGNTNNVNQTNVNTTAGGIISGVATIYCSASSNIQYIMGYTSVGNPSMSYTLNIKVKPI